MLPTSDERGFTLLEMLIVMAIAELAAGAAILLFPRLSDRLMTDKLANRIVLLLDRTSTKARETGADQIVQLDADSRTLTSSSGDVIPIDDGFSILWRSAKEIQSGRNDQAFLMFATGGSSGGDLEISRGTTSVTIEVDWLTGIARENHQ